MTQQLERMQRVQHFYSCDGSFRRNTDRLLAPFRLMVDDGDFFEVEPQDALAGNLASIASYYSKKLKRKFQFRTVHLGNGRHIYRVTLKLSKPARQAKAPGRDRKTTRQIVETFTTAEGVVMPNTAHDQFNRRMKFPLRIMPVGSWFIAHQGKPEEASARAMAYQAGLDLERTFACERNEHGRLAVIRTA